MKPFVVKMMNMWFRVHFNNQDLKMRKKQSRLLDVNEDEFIVIAWDGIWDVQMNQECVQMVADIFSEGESDIGLVCEEVSGIQLFVTA